MRVQGTLTAPTRVFLALAMMAVSFFLLRQLYYDSCIIPMRTGEFVVFFLLPSLFLAGFVWLLSELTYTALSMTALVRVTARLLSVAVALILYAAAAWGMWLSSPGPEDAKDDAYYRWTLSAFWSAGILDKTGNFSEVSCGY